MVERRTDMPYPPHRRLPLLCALAACGPPKPAATDVDETTQATTHASDTDLPPLSGWTTSAMTHASDTDLPPSGCVCVRSDDRNEESYDWETCGWGPCGTIELGCAAQDGFGACDPGPLLLDVEALDCALELLITGAPGMVHYERTFDSHYSGDGGFVRVAEGRLGLSRTWFWEDLGGSDSELTVVTLRDPAYFADCKAKPDPYDRYRCMQDWAQGSPLAVCDDAEHYEP
jgi:hypothetical protein